MAKAKFVRAWPLPNHSGEGAPWSDYFLQRFANLHDDQLARSWIVNGDRVGAGSVRGTLWEREAERDQARA